MLKRYVSKYQLRVIVGGRGISFWNTTGGSEYVTSDETEQRMLESHPEFGSQFDLDSTLLARIRQQEEEERMRKEEISRKKAALEAEKLRKMQEATAPRVESSDRKESPLNSPANEVDVSDDGITIVEAQSITDAKNYLFQKFGIAKTRMLRKIDLLNRAAECKVRFTGADF